VKPFFPLTKLEQELLEALKGWYEMFAPVRREGTDGADLLDKTLAVIKKAEGK
jgi:hypothetical protein